MFKRKQSKNTISARQRLPAPNAGRTSSVFSYHASRSQRPGSVGRETAEEQQESSVALSRKLARPTRLRKALHTLVLVGCAVLLLSSLLLGTEPKVVTVNAASDTDRVFLRDAQTYQAAAQTILGDSLLNKTKLTVNVESISQQMIEQFPELESVTVTLPLLGRQPVLYVQPTVPQLILATSNGTFILDQDGRALLADSQVPRLDRLKLPVVQDQSGISIQRTQIALPSDSVAFIAEVIRQLQAKGLKIGSIVLPTGTSELDVRLDGAPYVVKFNLRGNAREESGAFLAAKQHLESQQKVPAEYMDVRVENRVYYK